MANQGDMCSGPNCQAVPEYQCSFYSEKGLKNKFYCLQHAVRFAVRFNLGLPVVNINFLLWRYKELTDLENKIKAEIQRRTTNGNIIKNQQRGVHYNIELTGSDFNKPYVARLYQKLPETEIKRWFYKVNKTTEGNVYKISGKILVYPCDIVEYRNNMTQHRLILNETCDIAYVLEGEGRDFWDALKHYFNGQFEPIKRFITENAQCPLSKCEE